MRLLYVDESGGSEPPDLHRSSTPVMVIAGLIVDAAKVKRLTKDFVALKMKHFPAKFASGKSLDHIKTEVKGNDINAMTRASGRNQRRQAARFRKDLLELLSRHDVEVVARVWVKQDGIALSPAKTYTYGIQDLTQHFEMRLRDDNDFGILIADSRNHEGNLIVAHSVFTQKWRSRGDPYRHLIEIPLFGASDNHAGLQLADLVASTFIFPMAVAAYGRPRTGNSHRPSVYEPVRADNGESLEALQYRYQDKKGYWRGGIAVKDPEGRRGSEQIFGLRRVGYTESDVRQPKSQARLEAFHDAGPKPGPPPAGVPTWHV
jgi:hypothetical protein